VALAPPPPPHQPSSRDVGRSEEGLREESLALTALVAERHPERGSSFAVRWLRRLLEEDDQLTIEEIALAASALAGLGGRGHWDALSTLSAMAERATRQTQRRRLAS
jgi:hypothetical protein